MIDVLALNSSRAWDATTILTVPLPWTVEVAAGKLGEPEAPIHVVPSSIIPFIEHIIPGSWNICCLPSICEVDSRIIDGVLVALSCCPNTLAILSRGYGEVCQSK